MVSKYFSNALDLLEFTNLTQNSIIKIQTELVKKLFGSIKQKEIEKSRLENLKSKKVRSKSHENHKTPARKLLIEEFYKNSELKTEEAKIFAKKLRKEAYEMAQRQKQREEKLIKKWLQEENEKKKAEEENLKIFEERRMQRLNELKKKSERRKKEIATLREIGEKDYRKVISEEPLFQKIEKSYENDILMQEQEKQKNELKKLKLLHKPLNHQELLSYMKHHDELKKEHDLRRIQDLKNQSLQYKVNSSALSEKSLFTAKIIEEEKLLKEEKEKAKQAKKFYLAKRIQYAEIVREIFPPKTDPLKEIKSLEKSRHVSIIKTSESTSSSKSWSIKKDTSSDTESRGSVMKRNWKKNSMIPEPKKKREPIYTDYLADKRVLRDISKTPDIPIMKMNFRDDILDETIPKVERISRLKDKANEIDKIAKESEVKLGVINPHNVKKLDFADQVNEMIINSIKTKLVILDEI
ncbi:unnamed protein product [Blepharisma stoltei]|uniref:Uncharacterized protein n=1 Tax=Blepharisma stoltei TaxID=1481888 RepID=A0AAU9JA90_9CILI|nr:unnamed protein product [Blepharisma stoltei]